MTPPFLVPAKQLIERVQYALAAAAPDQLCPDPEMACAELLVADGLIVPGVPAENVATCLAKGARQAWGCGERSRLLCMTAELLEAQLLVAPGVAA